MKLIRRRVPLVSSAAHPARSGNDLDAWVRSLPWVVERPRDDRWPGVCVFVVDCPLLARRRLWLLTGLGARTSDGTTGSGLAAVMPVRACREMDASGWVQRALPSMAGHVLVTTSGDTVPARDNLETLVLTALRYAMS